MSSLAKKGPDTFTAIELKWASSSKEYSLGLNGHRRYRIHADGAGENRKNDEKSAAKNLRKRRDGRTYQV